MKYQLYNHDQVQERYVTLTKENLGDGLWDKLFEQLGETGADIYNNVELKVESAMFQNHNPIVSRVADLPNIVSTEAEADATAHVETSRQYADRISKLNMRGISDA